MKIRIPARPQSPGIDHVLDNVELYAAMVFMAGLNFFFAFIMIGWWALIVVPPIWFAIYKAHQSDMKEIGLNLPPRG